MERGALGTRFPNAPPLSITEQGEETGLHRPFPRLPLASLRFILGSL